MAPIELSERPDFWGFAKIRSFQGEADEMEWPICAEPIPYHFHIWEDSATALGSPEPLQVT
jgi:hypothetical protein